jgi:hypothetical protein
MSRNSGNETISEKAGEGISCSNQNHLGADHGLAFHGLGGLHLYEELLAASSLEVVLLVRELHADRDPGLLVVLLRRHAPHRPATQPTPDSTHPPPPLSLRPPCPAAGRPARQAAAAERRGESCAGEPSHCAPR